MTLVDDGARRCRERDVVETDPVAVDPAERLRLAQAE